MTSGAPVDFTVTGEGVRFAVLAAPRAPRSEVAGVHGGALKVRLAAPPVDGAANKELVAALAKFFGTPKAAVAVTAGRSSRRKTALVRGMDAAGFISRVAALAK